jgi:hypothetical protein
MLEVVKSALGKDSIAAVMENAYTPSPEEYTQWLDVIQGYARDTGRNINKKGDFFDVAGAVLDNVDEMPHSMQYPVMKKLWLNSQAQKHDKKIAGIAQAAEEEERVACAARTMVGMEDEEFGDEGLGAGDDLGVDEEDPEADMVADGSVDFDDQLDGNTDDEAFADSAARDSMSADDGDGDVPWWDAEDDTDEAAFPKHAARNAEDRPDDLAGMPEDDTFDPAARDYNDSFSTRPPPSFENEEKTAPKKQMSVLQQMLTLPKNSINTLVRDVESEGAAAWKQHAKPQNPHPTGSMAFKAWERGMTKAMKEQLGLNKEPTKPAPKKKTKR